MIFIRIDSITINLVKIESFSCIDKTLLFDMDSGIQQTIDLKNEQEAKLMFENICAVLGVGKSDGNDNFVITNNTRH